MLALLTVWATHSTLLHQAWVAHEICEVHGTLEHADGGLEEAHRGVSSGIPPLKTTSAARIAMGERHAHDACDEVLSQREDDVTDVPALWATRASRILDASASQHIRAASASVSMAALMRAPKASPPNS